MEFDGAQLELGPVATPLIFTTGSAVTRSADLLELTGAEFAKMGLPAAFTCFTEFQADNVASSNPAFSIDDGTSNNRIQIRRNGTTAANSVIVAGGVVATTFSILADSHPADQFRRHSLAVAAGDHRNFVQGVSLGSGAGAMPTGMNRIQFGTGVGTNPTHCIIKRMTIFPGRLSDSVLQSLSTP